LELKLVPLQLIILYINDLHISIKNCKTIHFVDDTTIICQEKSQKNQTKRFNRDLVLLVQWLRANKISLDTSKTVLILFKNKRKPVTKKSELYSLFVKLTLIKINMVTFREWIFKFRKVQFLSNFDSLSRIQNIYNLRQKKWPLPIFLKKIRCLLRRHPSHY